MFCPKCGTEYRKGFTTCSDCDVPLVNEPLLELPSVEKPSTIFRQLDETIITFVQKHYPKPSEQKGIKPHSIITIIAIFFSTSSLSPFLWIDETHNLQSFFAVYRIVFAFFCLALYIFAYYAWRIYFMMRTEGAISDKNLFFSESAGLYRKIVFYAALIPYFANKAYYRFAPAAEYHETINKWRYASLTDLFHEAGITIYQNAIFFIVTVECLRLIYTWSDRKHVTVVVLITVFLSIFQLVVRYSISGHGMFW